MDFSLTSVTFTDIFGVMLPKTEKQCVKVFSMNIQTYENKVSAGFSVSLFVHCEVDGITQMVKMRPV